MLGKSSILTRSHGESHGKSGSYSTNTQSSGRELLAPDEVRMDNYPHDSLYRLMTTRPAEVEAWQ